MVLAGHREEKIKTQEKHERRPYTTTVTGIPPKEVGYLLWWLKYKNTPSKKNRTETAPFEQHVWSNMVILT